MFFDTIQFDSNCYLKRLEVDKRNLIGTWGIETADSKSFLSFENGGYDYSYDILTKSNNGDELKYSGLYNFNDGQFKLCLEEEIIENKIIRNHNLIAVKDSYFMDFVTRFQFNKDIFPYAKIHNQTYKHENLYINYQYETEEVELFGKEFSVKIKVLDVKKVNNFKQTIYIRGNEDNWVVHVRLFPSKHDKEIVKLVRYTKKARPLPDSLSSMILRSKLSKYLWYNGERSNFKLPINAFGLVKVNTNEMLGLKTLTTFERLKR